MDKKAFAVLAVVTILLSSYATSVFVFFTSQGSTEKVRVACVGDSLTQSTSYPYYLWMLLGTANYSLHNFGAGSTTISLNTETPYMNTTAFEDALDFQPNIVVIMLGTNDAQSNLKSNNATLTRDYIKLINTFQTLPSKPEIWIALPPPIYSNQTSNMDAQYFKQTIIPCIQQAAEQTGVKTVDVYSALLGHLGYYKADGVHIANAGAEIVAQTVYGALTGQNNTASISARYRA